MSLLRIAIVDDEPPARRKLARMLEQVPDAKVIGQAGSGAEAIALLNREQPDVVFLDIQMPDMDGFAVLRAIDRPPKMKVVFVTAFDQHALRAFEVHALDYLLKPASAQRLEQVIERARQSTDSSSDEQIKRLLEHLGSKKSYARRIPLDTGDRVFLVQAAEIDLIESARNYVVVHTCGETHQIRSSLDAFAMQLDPEHFPRINRSQVVNLDRVREVRPWFHGDYRVVLRNGSEVNWSRRFSPKARLSGVQAVPGDCKP